MISFPNLLTLVFVVCKLTGVIAWSWWLVFLPTIASAGLGLLVLGAIALAAADSKS
jgi:hypothetical protein